QPARVPPRRPRHHRAAGPLARGAVRRVRPAERPAARRRHRRASPDDGGTGTVEHLDVLVVGAGLSGVAAGHYLRTRCPWASWAILEARDAIGGTWDLFRYPGVRSDSDMHTLGYSFRPWTGDQAIADGASILRYIRETAAAE